VSGTDLTKGPGALHAQQAVQADRIKARNKAIVPERAFRIRRFFVEWDPVEILAKGGKLPKIVGKDLPPVVYDRIELTMGRLAVAVAWDGPKLIVEDDLHRVRSPET
jgi:hypothetical protein